MHGSRPGGLDCHAMVAGAFRKFQLFDYSYIIVKFAVLKKTGRDGRVQDI